MATISIAIRREYLVASFLKKFIQTTEPGSDAQDGLDNSPSPPRRPGSRWPLTLCLLVSVGVVAATVLLANDGKNLKSLRQALGFTIETRDTFLARPSQLPPPTRPRWPWVAVAASPSTFIRPFEPQAACSSLAPPETDRSSFVINEQNWECAFLFEPRSDAETTLFFQARGQQAVLSSLRIKFNLDGAGMTPAITRRALAFMSVYLPRPVLDFELQDKLEERLIEQNNFNLFFGDYAISFRRELNDLMRFNLIVTRSVDQIGHLPRIIGPGAFTPSEIEGRL